MLPVVFFFLRLDEPNSLFAEQYQFLRNLHSFCGYSLKGLNNCLVTYIYTIVLFILFALGY